MMFDNKQEDSNDNDNDNNNEDNNYEYQQSAQYDSQFFGKSRYAAILVLIVIGTILLVAVCVWYFAIVLIRRIKAKNDETKKKTVYPYLQNFDVEDIDIRRAPTGGWHGTYHNKLVYGINDYETLKKSDISDSSSSSNNDTIIEDYEYNNDNEEDTNEDEYNEDYTDVGNKIGAAKKQAYYGGGCYDKVDDFFGRRPKDSLFMDATTSMPYLLGDMGDSDSNQYNNNNNNNKNNDANSFGLTAQDSKDVRPWRMEGDII